MRQICSEAVDLVKKFEGLHRLGDDGLVYPYKDPIGLCTVGYGTLLSNDRNMPLDTFDAITLEQAELLLKDELRSCAVSVARLVDVPLTDGQFGALVSFTYNLGAGSLQSSTLRRRLLDGDYAAAADQFPRWNRAGGRVLAGLTRRRLAERDLFVS